MLLRNAWYAEPDGAVVDLIERVPLTFEDRRRLVLLRAELT
jgi:hypothetical protein